MKRRLALAATAVLLTAACGSHPDHGQVIAKSHDAAYDYMTMQCAFWAKYGCASWVPIYNHVPECWGLRLANGQDEWDVCVDKTEWDTTGVGASWQEKP